MALLTRLEDALSFGVLGAMAGYTVLEGRAGF